MSSASGAPPADLQRVVFWLTIFWLALYIVRYHRRRASRITALPSLSSSTWPSSTELFRSSATRITLEKCHLRYQSTAWNALHQSSTARLAKRRGWRRALQLVYDVGSMLGILGMFASVLLLLWTTVQLSSALYTRFTHHEHVHQPGGILKRDFSEEDGDAYEARAAPVLQLIIPGLTTPLHHLPLLLVALITTQVIHECGHAVAAALDAIPLTSAGLGITVILPSAFVSFPSEETESLAPRPRARLICAGAFHNLMFWLVLGAAAWLQTSNIVWPLLGYHDVSQYGRVIVDVDEASPLYGHLPVSAVIIKVGDEILAAPGGAADRWNALMATDSSKSVPRLGWCADEPWFAAQDTTCCAIRRSAVTSLSCFASLGELQSEHCVDPLHFLQPTQAESVLRCSSAAECGHNQLCIRPRGDQELMSLTMHIPPWLRTNEQDSERTVVWQGERAEVAEEVDLGDWLPGHSWLPIGLPFVWGTLFSYLKMLTLSLYFFNLLPLPFLDGGQLYDALYDAYAVRHQRGDEAVPLRHMEEGEEDAHSAWREGARVQNVNVERRALCRKVVHVGVGALTGSCIILGLANSYL
ncbi:hypothetical protein C2E23DRAFT_813672 [Lenzites betulinus]|nr:hypothetical protein C2E23DRAFT_813672 [Lenzites betulinus]